MSHGVTIAGTGSYLPEKILTNHDLSEFVETSDEWIVTRTGIKERRIAAEGENTSHLAAKASLQALEQSGIPAADIELIIVATITPDTFTPATACYVQEQIGASRAVAFDISAACSGFLYAMKIAKRLIESGAFANALIIGAEKLSAFVDWSDRSTCVLFGDGAGAAVLRPSAEGEGKIIATDIGTDGKQTSILSIPGGGSACPTTPQNVGESLATFSMSGREVFKHAVTRMKNSANSVIERAGLQPEDPYIIANEAAERFSFYGMKAALAIFLANYLGVLGGANLSESQATSYVSYFNGAVYLTPLLGALIADTFFGKYRTIMTLSIVYCLGHLCLAFMGVGGVVQLWLLAGLGMIALGAGGIKPCVSAHVGDQFGKSNQYLLPKIFNIFYFSINAGAVISNLSIPWILKWYGPHWAFGIPGVLMALATLCFWMGRRKFIHVPAQGASFLKELFSKEGLIVAGKLMLLFYVFVSMFWCLGSFSWCFPSRSFHGPKRRSTAVKHPA